MSAHLTDLKIWLFSRIEEGKNIKNTMNNNMSGFKDKTKKLKYK
jgi:hypothetical protein